MNLRKLFNFGPPADIDKIYENGALVVDVRTEEEFRGGHFKNSINIPLSRLGGYMDELKNKNKEIITVCRSGARSGQAKGLMKRAGITAFNGGGWQDFQRKVS